MEEDRRKTRQSSMAKIDLPENKVIPKKVEIIQKGEEEEKERNYETRLRKKESTFSTGTFGQIPLDELQLPDLMGGLTKKTSSYGRSSIQLRSSTSNIFFHSPGFASNTPTNSMLIGPSPRGGLRNWTPLCPSPNVTGDIFRGNYDFKTNNEDLDNVMLELRRKIEENS